MFGKSLLKKWGVSLEVAFKDLINFQRVATEGGAGVRKSPSYSLAPPVSIASGMNSISVEDAHSEMVSAIARHAIAEEKFQDVEEKYAAAVEKKAESDRNLQMLNAEIQLLQHNAKSLGPNTGLKKSTGAQREAFLKVTPVQQRYKELLKIHRNGPGEEYQKAARDLREFQLKLKAASENIAVTKAVFTAISALSSPLSNESAFSVSEVAQKFRVLLCAPSEAAANVLCLRLAKLGISSKQMHRLFWWQVSCTFLS